uniref:Uncharacterized protein n=1 Tax=Knipowitschia caucasica TaxID=637954 RepID=A0AAV2JAZ3_KNICA
MARVTAHAGNTSGCDEEPLSGAMGHSVTTGAAGSSTASASTAIVNPDETPSEDTQLGSASSAPSTRSASPAPSSNNPPSSPTPSSSSSRQNTPTPRKRKRTDSQRILDFLQAESDKEQRRHEESEEKTLRFLSLFERMVEKL